MMDAITNDISVGLMDACDDRKSTPRKKYHLLPLGNTHFFVFLLFLIQQQQDKLFLVQCRSIDRNKPHNHHGILTPYPPGPFLNFQLQPDDEQSLAEGKPVMKQVADTSTPSSSIQQKKNENDEGHGGGQGGRAICIQDVHAPKEAVWRQILDVDSYGGKVSSVKECKNYSFHVDNKKENIQFKTKMVIGVMPGYSVRYTNRIIKKKIWIQNNNDAKLNAHPFHSNGCSMNITVITRIILLMILLHGH